METLHVSEACRRAAALAREGGTGRVHSAFRTAVNLEIGGRLICLLGAGRTPHPYSMVLAPLEDLRPLGLAPGAAAAMLDGAVTLGGAAGPLRLPLEGAALSDLAAWRLEGLRMPPDPVARLDALALAAAQSPNAAQGLAPMMGRLAPEGFPPLPGNHFSDFLLPRAGALPGLLHGGGGEALREAGRMLAGCGPGLTPSSDDLLAGLAAALWAADVAGLWPGGRDRARVLTTGAAGATGVISAAALRSAAEGLFSRDILDLLAAFFSTKPLEALRAAARRVAGFGATSGADTLSGLWFGLDLVYRRAMPGPASTRHPPGLPVDEHIGEHLD